MSQAAPPSLTVAQLHTPLTNVPTLAHALTSGDKFDKHDVHQLLCTFAERSDGNPWDYTVSRKRSRKGEPDATTDKDGSERAESSTPKRAKRERGEEDKENESEDNYCDASVEAEGKRKKAKKSEATSERLKPRNGTQKRKTQKEPCGTRKAAPDRKRRKQSRARKQLNFDTECEQETSEKDEATTYERKVKKVTRRETDDEARERELHALEVELDEPTLDNNTYYPLVDSGDAWLDDSALLDMPPRGRRHSLIFPLLRSPFLQCPDTHEPPHYAHGDYCHTTPLPAGRRRSASYVPLPPPTPPPPPSPGPWYSMLLGSIPTPPPPPPLESRVSSPAPLSHQYLPSPSPMPTTPDITYTAPTPALEGNYPWSWLSEADEEDILCYLKSPDIPPLAQPSQMADLAVGYQALESLPQGRFDQAPVDTNGIARAIRPALARLRYELASSPATRTPLRASPHSLILPWGAPTGVIGAASQQHLHLAPSSASSSHPSSPYAVDMEGPFYLSTLDLPPAASPLLPNMIDIPTAPRTASPSPALPFWGSAVSIASPPPATSQASRKSARRR